MSAPLELWGGLECTCNRVRERWFDQTLRSGHEHRPADIEAFAAFGLRTLRYPALWERMAPSHPDDIEWRWTDERLTCLRQLGIRPILTLVHHGSGPAYTSLLDTDFAEKLARFAGAVARRYPWIEDYTIVNEPLTTARFSGLYGHWYPHARSDAVFVSALIQQVKGTVLGMRAIRAVVPRARLIQTDDCGRTSGTAPTQPQVDFENHRRWLTWDLLTGGVTTEHPLHRYLSDAGFSDADRAFFLEADCPPDIVGLNYYLTSDRFIDHRIQRYPDHLIGGNREQRYADVEAVRRPDGIAGHTKHLVDAYERYGRTVAITETHLGCTREEQMRWLMEAWRGAEHARQAGARVSAVTVWALLGSFDWDSLVTRERDHYEPGLFDVRSTPPRVTALAPLVADLAVGLTPAHPALAGTPWWRRTTSLVSPYAPAVVSGSAPILILGTTGTLAQAFARVCVRRGLSHLAVNRQQVDVTRRDDVEQVVRRVMPWAVINTTGFVRVDEAEHDAAGCFTVNVTGAEHVAMTCERAGLRLLTFSSDLVFGDRCEEHLEATTPDPLSVYGVTKAEAERRVAALMPRALVVRTSAFFGPWDRHNFLARLFDALDNGRTFEAAVDEVVSPTYLPELADTTLDLLIDDEHGVWHLSNQGAVTWYEFARLAARHNGNDETLIVPVAMRDQPGRARRPSNSALSSSRGVLMRPLSEALEAFLRDTQPSRVTRAGYAISA